MSGVGSIVFRDEETLLNAVADREAVYATAIVPYKSALEIWYSQNQSFWLDIKLIFLTLFAVVNSGLDLNRYLQNLPQPPAALVALRAGLG